MPEIKYETRHITITYDFSTIVGNVLPAPPEEAEYDAAEELRQELRRRRGI